MISIQVVRLIGTFAYRANTSAAHADMAVAETRADATKMAAMVETVAAPITISAALATEGSRCLQGGRLVR